MGQVTSLFAYKVLANVDRSLDHGRLLDMLGLKAADIDPKHMVSDQDYYQFLEAIAKVDPNALDLPLRTGLSMRCDDYGAFGLAWKSAPHLLGSLERAVRYGRVLTSVSMYEVRPESRGSWMLLHRAGNRRLGLRLSNEATVASILTISNETSTQSVAPLEVHFRHPAPPNIELHVEHFGCPVVFGSDKEGLLFDEKTLAVPNRLADQGLACFFEKHLDSELEQFVDEARLEWQVRGQISTRLSNGIPTISEVAESLGMSGRTLQRHLSDEGVSFRNLIDESRRQLAEKLLADEKYSMIDIAFLTGFSEQSAFNRAFKRWAGQTPRSFRLKSLGE